MKKKIDVLIKGQDKQTNPPLLYSLSKVKLSFCLGRERDYKNNRIIKLNVTLCLSRITSCLVSVSAFAMTGTMFTLWSTAFMNFTSSGFSLNKEIKKVHR